MGAGWQARILLHLAGYPQRNSAREIGMALDCTPERARQELMCLERAGMVQRDREAYWAPWRWHLVDQRDTVEWAENIQT